MFTPTPQESAAQAERRTALEKDPAEHFAGYALMGMPFSSGHYLAFRRFPASSIGPGYHAVWLRTPQGRWSIYADAPWEVSCARYFGAAVAHTHVAGVSGDWSSPWQLMVSVPGVVRWEIDLGTSWVTSLATGMAQRMPAAWWRNDRLLGAMGTLMGPMLSAGRMSMAGVVPNGQSFQAKPQRIWAVTGSRASIDGFDAGTPRPLPEQEQLADFWLPQRGLFVSELSLRFPSTAVSPMPGAVQAHGRQS